ncbi:hypothetical protein H5410_022042 [Solanum commersonii]|uniref:Uncharacterized protein n=1 Tax=Solanum commersonii TaxID=4109 RepID=A0A9J5ZD17_SOLCO|nr:hypothetical protein H5410_022042 [Solanum commersonii]
MLEVAYAYREPITMQFNSHNTFFDSKLNDKFFFPIPQIYLTAILFNPQYKEYCAKALVKCIYQNLDSQPDEEPHLETCQNSIKLLAKEMSDKYYSLDNVENPQMSMPQVGAHGRMKHKLGLDSSNKCEFVKYLETGSDNITNEEGIPQLLN